MAEAETVADLHAALQPVIDTRAPRPIVVPAGALVLQPSEARRRSGSHYTPRELTEPIVRTTLEPILARLRGPRGEAAPAGGNSRSEDLRPGNGLGGPFWWKRADSSATPLIESWRAATDAAAPATAEPARTR